MEKRATKFTFPLQIYTQLIMFFPYSTSHQTVTNFANSAKETATLLRNSDNVRVNQLDELFARRVHELMNFRPHTVNTDGADF